MQKTRGSRVQTAMARRIGGYSPLMRWYRSVRPQWLWRMTSPYGSPTTHYVTENGFTVRRGLFQGLTFPARALGHANYLASKLAGSYEPEVLEFIGSQVESSDTFVDLGSGDGFFCVGVARLADIKVVGFETNAFEQKLALELAEMNDVSIEVRGLATASELNSMPDGKLLLLCDIEGFEEDLIDPVACERLRSATMVIEVHERVRPNVVEVLTKRFESTHSIERAFASSSEVGNFSELASWDSDPASFALSDGHSDGNSWLMMKPR